MNTLHILSYAPFSHTCFADCITLLMPEDGLLLTGDAVYALQPNTQAYRDLCSLDARIMLYVLREDLIARALAPIETRIITVDYPDWVTLCTQYRKVHSWL